MKRKPATMKGKILLTAVILGIILLLGMFDIGSVRSGIRIGYVGKEGRSSWSGQYVSLDGFMKKTLYPKDDRLHIEVETDSGSLSIEIKDRFGKVIFDENDIGTQSFDVPVSGKISIRIDADKHQGGFRIGGEKK